MKKTLIAIASSFLFSTLFYHQSLGLNMLLFAIIAIAAVFTIHERARRLDVYLSAGLYLACSFFVFAINSGLSYVTSIFSFIIFSGSISGFKNSIYVQWFNGIYQLLIGALHQLLSNKEKKETTTKKHNLGFIALTTSLVITVLIIFILLYGSVNPILGSWLSKIDMSFISLSWIITTVMGYLLVSNLLATAELDAMTTLDRNASTLLKAREINETTENKLAKEHLLGSVLMIALNMLIVLFIALDVSYVLSNPLSDAASLSKTVHEGVTALVTSIIIAITIILILFRGNLNFYKESDKLRKLTYAWIFLNIGIILLTAYKNYLYSDGFGLTYKRIGVFIYLTLCISGMVTTYFKIARKNNLLFMFQANARVAFIIMIVISSFSWDRVITKQNLSQVEHPDMSYLLYMSDNTADLLYAFAKAHPEESSNQSYIYTEYERWLQRLSNQSWQEKTLQGMLHSKTTSNDILNSQTQD